MINWETTLELEELLSETHNSGCPLDFDELATFPKSDFAHDVAGIQRHIDRETGELGGCFVPRCAVPEVPR